MDGLISSLQYSRHTAFNYTEKNEDDKNKGNKGQNSSSSADKTTLSSTTTLENYTVTERDSNGGNKGNGQFGSGQQTLIANNNSIQDNRFSTVLGDMMAGKAIVDAALKLVQDVKKTMLEEFQKSLGVPTGNLAGKDTNITINNMTLQFESIITSGNTSQSVSVNISLNQTMIEENMPAFLDYLNLISGKENSYFLHLNASSSSININTSGVNMNFSSTQIQLNMGMTQVQGGIALSPNLNLIDPLIIDLGGDGVELSSDHFEFDLDADGTSDQISRPTGNSGFLALDKNNDGKINDGTELFGTQSGDGFKDLAKYDSNSDGKIDKNDPIFNKLRIWKPDASGNGQLIGLGEVGIGAIYLDAKSNEKLFESASGQTLGVQRKSAAYERTDGTLGGIHHVDLAKHQNNNTEDTHTNKLKGLAAYKHSQGELDRLRFLNNKPTSGNELGNLQPYYEEMNALLGDTGLLNTKKDQIAQKIENIKQGNISEEDLAMIELDMLLSKNPQTSFVSLLDNAVFEGELGQINSSLFQYNALLRAQRLLS